MGNALDCEVTLVASILESVSGEEEPILIDFFVMDVCSVVYDRVLDSEKLEKLHGTRADERLFWIDYSTYLEIVRHYKGTNSFKTKVEVVNHIARLIEKATLGYEVRLQSATNPSDKLLSTNLRKKAIF